MRIPPVARARAAARLILDETLDKQPSQPHLVQRGCDLGAQIKQPLQPERSLICCYLEDAADQGVADRPAGVDILGSDLIDDFGAQGFAIAKNYVRAGQGLHSLYKLPREGEV